MATNKEAGFKPLDLIKTIPMRNIGSDQKPHFVHDPRKIIQDGTG